MSDGNGPTVSTVGISDIFFTALSLVLYLVDIVLDIVLLCNYYASGDTRFFAFTLTALLVSSLIINMSSLWMNDRSSNHSKWIVYIFFGLQILPALG